MDIFKWSSITMNIGCNLLCCCVFLAVVDHFWFDEHFRATIGIVGKGAFVIIAQATVLVIVKGAYDKFKKAKNNRG